MAKSIFNWNFKDVVKVLEEHHFIHSHTKGSHYYYTGHYGKEPRIVQVQFHTSKTLKPKTFKAIVKQSGIPMDIWLK